MEKEKHEMHKMHDGVERATFRMPTPVEEMRQPKPEYWKAERIAENIEAEGEAIKGYMELLGSMDPVADAGSIQELNKIVAEEKRHIEILQKMLMAYDGCIKPEKPGMGHDGKPEMK